MLIPGVAALAAGSVFWWWNYGGADKPVTEAEARRYLDKIVAAAQARDFGEVCHLNGTDANCRYQLQTGCDERPFDSNPLSCKETVPDQPPRVVSTRYLEKRGDGTPGRILVLTGTDRLGRPYKSELLVFRENRNHFEAINAVYWMDSHIIEGDTVTPPPPPPD